MGKIKAYYGMYSADTAVNSCANNMVTVHRCAYYKNNNIIISPKPVMDTELCSGPSCTQQSHSNLFQKIWMQYGVERIPPICT